MDQSMAHAGPSDLETTYLASNCIRKLIGAVA
jgi:hypothetical protein